MFICGLVSRGMSQPKRRRVVTLDGCRKLCKVEEVEVDNEEEDCVDLVFR